MFFAPSLLLYSFEFNFSSQNCYNRLLTGLCLGLISFQTTFLMPPECKYSLLKILKWLHWLQDTQTFCEDFKEFHKLASYQLVSSFKDTLWSSHAEQLEFCYCCSLWKITFCFLGSSLKTHFKWVCPPLGSHSKPILAELITFPSVPLSYHFPLLCCIMIVCLVFLSACEFPCQVTDDWYSTF